MELEVWTASRSENASPGARAYIRVNARSHGRTGRKHNASLPSAAHGVLLLVTRTRPVLVHGCLSCGSCTVYDCRLGQSA